MEVLSILWIFMFFTVVNNFRLPTVRRKQTNKNNQSQIRSNAKNSRKSQGYYRQVTYYDNKQSKSNKQSHNMNKYQHIPLNLNKQGYVTQNSFYYPINQNNRYNYQNQNQIKQQHVFNQKQTQPIMCSDVNKNNNYIQEKIKSNKYKSINTTQFSKQKLNNQQKSNNVNLSSNPKTNLQLQKKIDNLSEKTKQQCHNNNIHNNSMRNTETQNLNATNFESNPKRAHNNSVKGKFNSVMGTGNNVIGNYNIIRPIVKGPNVTQ